MPHVIENRAHTDKQKREVIDRLFFLWRKNPYLRLGQLIGNYREDNYYTEDFDFIQRLERHYNDREKTELSHDTNQS